VETTLHRQLKARYGTESGGRTEVHAERLSRRRRPPPKGALIEVQSGPLGPLERQAPGASFPITASTVVKPVVIRPERVVRRAPRGTAAATLSVRRSPWQGAGRRRLRRPGSVLAQVFPHPNLRVDVLGVEIDEVRIPAPAAAGLRRRRSLPASRPPPRSRSVSRATSGRSCRVDWTAPVHNRRPSRHASSARVVFRANGVAYCLRLSGAVETLGKIREPPDLRGVEQEGQTSQRDPGGQARLRRRIFSQGHLSQTPRLAPVDAVITSPSRGPPRPLLVSKPRGSDERMHACKRGSRASCSGVAPARGLVLRPLHEQSVLRESVPTWSSSGSGCRVTRRI